MATLKDVADKAGVTVTTVSRMLNNKVNVSEKTKKKIYRAMDALDYTPNELARALTMQRSNVIGLIIPSAKHFFFADMIHCIEEYVSAQKYKLLLCVSDLDEKKESEYFTMLKANRVAGVIVASRTQNIGALINFKAPIVTIERTLTEEIPSISSDNYTGGSLAAVHLLKAGCKALAYIGGSPELDMEGNKRFTGFSETLCKEGIKEPVVINATERDFIKLDYENVIESLFQNHRGIDGIFATNDIIAAQILQYCHRHGIKVPEQMKIIGYDDTKLCSLCFPTISSISQPIDEMCRCAVETVIQLSEGKMVPSRILFPVHLVERESSIRA